MIPSPGHSHRARVELRFWEWPGDPPPALLLHGIGNYGRYWDALAHEIRGRLRLVAPDARGHGDSGKPDRGYTSAELVADALAVLDTLAVERALVVGHSMGGTHALRLSNDHPDRVLALVLVDVGPESMREGTDRARRLTLTRPESFADREEALAYLRMTSPGYEDEVYAGRLEHAFRQEHGPLPTDPARLVWRSSSAALAQIMAARTAPEEQWAGLRSIRCPLLIVRGSRSNVLAPSTADRMRRERSVAQPGVRTQLLELDAGHNVALERPRELAEKIVELARSVAATPGSMRRWIP